MQQEMAMLWQVLCLFADRQVLAMSQTTLIRCLPCQIARYSLRGFDNDFQPQDHLSE